MSTGPDGAQAPTAPSPVASDGVQSDVPTHGAGLDAGSNGDAVTDVVADTPAEAPKRKPQPTSRERAERKREEKLESVREEVKAGSLVIRQMTDEERARYPPRENAPRPKRFGGR